MNGYLRKHLYPSGPKSYPTLAQKHFNAADAWANQNNAIYRTYMYVPFFLGDCVSP